MDLVTYTADTIPKEIITMPDTIPASTSLPVTMDLHCMIYIPIITNTTKPTAGTIQTEPTTIEAGTAVWKVTQMIQKY